MLRVEPQYPPPAHVSRRGQGRAPPARRPSLSSQALTRLFVDDQGVGSSRRAQNQQLPSYESSTRSVAASSSRTLVDLKTELATAGPSSSTTPATPGPSETAPPSYATSNTPPSELGYIPPTDASFTTQPVVFPRRARVQHRSRGDAHHVVTGMDMDIHTNTGPLHLDLHSIISHARTVLSTLSGVGFFGAAIAFSAFYTAKPTEPSSVLALLAWSYTSYLLATLVTVVWQMALASSFGRFKGHVFRSQGGILCAMVSAVLGITAGTLLMTLALTQRTARGVQSAGYAVVTAILAFALVCTARLYYTLLPSSQLPCPPPPINLEPTPVEIEIAEFLEGFATYGQIFRYLAQSPVFNAASVEDQATRLVLATRALTLDRDNHDAGGGYTDQEFARALQFLDLASSWLPLVRDLEEYAGDAFWDTPLATRVAQVMLLHKALRPTYANRLER